MLLFVSCATVHHSAVEKTGLVIYEPTLGKSYFINKDVNIEATICTKDTLPKTEKLVEIFRNEYKNKTTLKIDGMSNITSYQVVKDGGLNCHYTQGHPVHKLKTTYYDKFFQIYVDLSQKTIEK